MKKLGNVFHRIPKVRYGLSGLFVGLFVLIAAGASPLRAETVTVEYRYDQAGRLISASYGATRKITYRYDKAGNLLGATVTTMQAGLEEDSTSSPTAASMDEAIPSDALARIGKNEPGVK